MKCLISCEHAVSKVPPRFAGLFEADRKILASHQAFDQGAAKIAEDLAERLNAKLYPGTITRLLVDLNRSHTNRSSLFSRYSRILDKSERQMLLKKYYYPYREKIIAEIDTVIRNHEPVLHLSIHTFTPEKNGRRRKADIGLLYDPARQREKNMCIYLSALLKRKIEQLRVRRNYPYQGKTDGFTTFLRKCYPDRLYAGIEIEINQDIFFSDKRKTRKITRVLAGGINNILQNNEFKIKT